MKDFPKDILKQAMIDFSRKPVPSQNLEIYFPAHNQKKRYTRKLKFCKEKYVIAILSKKFFINS